MGEVTVLLQQWEAGDEKALDRIFPLVYTQLKALANSYMKQEQGGRTLQATALVNEVYLKMVNSKGIEFQDREHFFHIGGKIMRQILVSAARKRAASKRGHGQKVHLDEIARFPMHLQGKDISTLLALDQALAYLEKHYPRLSHIVELRYFMGMEVSEVAQVLGLSATTVKRDWREAKHRLYILLQGPNAKTLKSRL